MINQAEANELGRGSRRLVYALAAVGTLALVGEKAAPKFIWPNSPTEIVDQEGDWLAYAGLGQQSADFIASGLEPQLGTIDYAQYSPRGINPKSIGQSLAAYYEARAKQPGGDRPQNIITHSMGLATYLKGVEWCSQNDVTVPPIDTIIAISSPLSIDDAYFRKAGLIVNNSHYPGGVFSKAAIEWINQGLYEGFKFHNFGRYAVNAIRASHSGHPPELWTSQIRLLASTRSLKSNAFDGIITRDTTIYHFGDDASDRTTKINLARQSLAKFINPYGARLVPVDILGMGHANVPAVAARLAEAAAS